MVHGRRDNKYLFDSVSFSRTIYCDDLHSAAGLVLVIFVLSNVYELKNIFKYSDFKSESILYSDLFLVQ